MSDNIKWPKMFPELTAKQKMISNDFMYYWHTILPKKYISIENFNNNYVIKNKPLDFIKTLEIGAGLGEHLFYETLSYEQRKNYVALELRANMAEQIKNNHPDIQVIVADCQQKIPVQDNEFERILAIHVLEHLPNLPAAIKEIYRVCHKKNGFFAVVIPCEKGMAYSFARKISAQRIFEKRYKQSYKWFIEREHVNVPKEIIEEITPYFKLESQKFFPFNWLPFIWCNLCIGFIFKPRLN
ncbi:MAG TPA: class I SAM-dependent methyltransferase [Candidatus Aquirickettsiella sp.]